MGGYRESLNCQYSKNLREKESITMKYKLLCTDIDGTLLNDDKGISKED
jgi:hypothetical protein